MTVTLSDDYTFQLGDTGVLLNSDATPLSPFVDVTSIAGLDSAPYRETNRDHEGADGGFLDAEFEKARGVVVDGQVFANVQTDIEVYLDSLKYNYAPSTVVIPFYFKTPGYDTRLLFVKPQGVKYAWETIRRTGMINVQFSMVAEDPRIYEAVLRTATISQGSTVTTGFSFPLSFSFGFGGTSSTTDGLNIYNYGNRPAPAILEIHGPCTGPRIVSDRTSSTLWFNITLGASDVLTVDLANLTVLLNGSANRRSTLSSAQWFLLQPGDNFMRYRVESGTASFLLIKYRSAWR